MPAPRGIPKVEVTFDVDANGILAVTAKDTATGKDQKITISASSGLSEAEIEKMVKDAAENEAEDKVRREQAERRNKLDSLCHTVEKILRENSETVGAADATALSALIKEARDALDKQNDVLVTAATGRLEAEARRIASVVSQGGSGNVAPGDGTPRTARDATRDRTDVVDAEFEDTQPGQP